MIPRTYPSVQSRSTMLKTRILVIITVGMSVGFLLGMGVSALLRAMIAGGDRGLEMTFTALVVFMAGILITYGLKFSPAGEATDVPRNEMHLSSPQSLDMETAETTPTLVASEATLPGGVSSLT